MAECSCAIWGLLPDLNRIENAYAKIKSHLRKGAARNRRQVLEAVGRSVKANASAT
jgi:hypothetical protein